MFKKKMILIILAFAVGFQTQLSAGGGLTKTGTTAAKFLSISMGARANAMGGAYTAVADEATAMYWNPAGIGNIESFEGIFTYTKMFADVNVNYFGAVFPAGNLGTFGVNVTALNISDMEVTTELDPEGTGLYFSAGSYAFGLTYARFITDNFAIGANIKYIREDIASSSADGIAIDIGTIFTTPFYGIKFASSITNFGGKMQMTGDDLLIRYDQDETTSGNNETIDGYLRTDEFDIPLRLQIGLAKDWTFGSHKLLIAVDAVYPNDNNQWVNVGGEIALFENLIALRAGYKSLFLEDSEEGLTAGFGLNYNRMEGFDISIDYSYQKYKHLDNIHSFGVRLGF